MGVSMGAHGAPVRACVCLHTVWCCTRRAHARARGLHVCIAGRRVRGRGPQRAGAAGERTVRCACGRGSHRGTVGIVAVHWLREGDGCAHAWWRSCSGGLCARVMAVGACWVGHAEWVCPRGISAYVVRGGRCAGRQAGRPLEGGGRRRTHAPSARLRRRPVGELSALARQSHVK